MKKTLSALVLRLPLIGRLIGVINAQSAEISRMRETFAYDINHMRETFSAEINLIREHHGSELKYLREEFSAHSASMSAFTVALTESVAMRSNAQLVEAERLSGLYESLTLRLSVLEAAQAEPQPPISAPDEPSRANA